MKAVEVLAHPLWLSESLSERPDCRSAWPTLFHSNESQDILEESRSILKCDVFLLWEKCLFSAAERWCGCLGWMMSGLKKLSYNDSSHLEFMREAVWAVNDALFYYYIWNVSRLTCMLKRLLIKHGSLCNLSMPACCVNTSSYKRHKHISALINAIKWSNDFSATVTGFMCLVA